MGLHACDESKWRRTLLGGVLGVVLATGVAAAAAARTAGQSSSPAPAPHGVLPRGGAAEHRAAPEGGVPSVTACRGSTPSLDGVVQRSEWADAASMLNGSGRPFARWTPEFSPVEDGRDLALTAAFVKYDSDALWFGFRVVDDVHFGGSWAPAGNAAANNLTAQGWPWFGDEMELLVDARPSATAGAGAGGSNVVGNASQWQMVCNTVKSRLGGWGVGGLMEGEPRNDGGKAWAQYRQWIESGAMAAATRPHTSDNGYDIEWRVGFECLSIAPGKQFDPDSMPPRVPLGVNVALGDVDTRAEGDSFYGLRHEQWWNGTKAGRTNLGEFGRLILGRDDVCHARLA